MRHDDLIFCNLKTDQLLGRVTSNNVTVHILLYLVHRQNAAPVIISTIWELTGTPKMWDSWSALVCRRQFPAFVTKTTGTTNRPWGPTSFSKAFFAAGIGILPLTSTPSMSNSSPKRGWGCRREKQVNQTKCKQKKSKDKHAGSAT